MHRSTFDSSSGNRSSASMRRCALRTTRTGFQRESVFSMSASVLQSADVDDLTSRLSGPLVDVDILAPNQIVVLLADAIDTGGIGGGNVRRHVSPEKERVHASRIDRDETVTLGRRQLRQARERGAEVAEAMIAAIECRVVRNGHGTLRPEHRVVSQHPPPAAAGAERLPHPIIVAIDVDAEQVDL